MTQIAEPGATRAETPSVGRVSHWINGRIVAEGKPAEQAYSVLVRHSKAGWNYELVDPPVGTEVLPDGYLIRVEVAKGKSEGSTKVVEQTPSTTTISIWDYRALDLL